MTHPPPIDESELRCSIEDGAWFAEARSEWDELVAAACCDPLFNGWAWRSAWWRHFDGDAGARLHVLVLRDPARRLCAALPLYSHRSRVRLLPLRRLQVLGSNYREAGDNEYSEYCDGCVRAGFEAVAARCFARALGALRWDELVSQCVRDDSWLACSLAPELARTGCGVRQTDELIAWGVPLDRGVEAWRQALSANVRRRTIAQRRRLRQPRLVQVRRDGHAAFVAELNECHIARWGRPVYSPRRIAFHQDLLDLLPQDALQASMLSDGEQRVSLQYNLRIGARVYNLQSGFHAAQAQQLSPGYLHLGYAIEAAARDGAVYFDMLGGSGKVRDYKADLGERGCTMVGLQIVRAAWLRGLYALWDRTQ